MANMKRSLSKRSYYLILSSLLFLALSNVQGEDSYANDIYTFGNRSYPSTVISPYRWSYIRVELPPMFASLTFELDTNVQLDLKSISKSHLHRSLIVCFQEGSPPLPDFSDRSIDGIVLDQVYNKSIIQIPIQLPKCYALQESTSFTLSNEQVAESVIYIGIFNGIGPERTQAKMIKRGTSYMFTAHLAAKECNGTSVGGQECNKPLIQLPCGAVRGYLLENSTLQRMEITCRNNLRACHDKEMSGQLFVLNVDNISEELRLLTAQNVTLNDKSINMGSFKSGHVSLMCYARNGAIPTELLFDYSEDISANPLIIKLPKLGSWYFYIVPVMHEFDVSGSTNQNPQLCYSLGWEVLGCPEGMAGPSCSYKKYMIKVNEEGSFISMNHTDLPFIEVPLEPILSTPFSGDSLQIYAWTYFLIEIEPHATSRNIRVELISDESTDQEIYARFGGLPSLDSWDFYYANQSNNSNNGSLFKLYESDDRRVKFDIVYAREGNWTIGLRHPVPMDNYTSLTTLSIYIEPCPGNCSGHGKCQSASKSEACSYCQCDLLHGGFDCALELVSKTEHNWQIAFLVGSNAAAVLPAMQAFRKKSYAEWVVFLSSGIASAIYHACDVQWTCLLDYHTLQFMDFWLSFVAVINTFVYLTSVSETASKTILSVVWILTALMAIGDPTSSRNVTFVMVIGAVCLVVALLADSWTKYRSFGTNFRRPRKIKSLFIKLVRKLYEHFRWRFVVMGFAALAFSATTWNLVNYKNYWIYHSLWHIAIYSAAFFFLCSKVQCSTLIVDGKFQAVPTESPRDTSELVNLHSSQCYSTILP